MSVRQNVESLLRDLVSPSIRLAWVLEYLNKESWPMEIITSVETEGVKRGLLPFDKASVPPNPLLGAADELAARGNRSADPLPMMISDPTIAAKTPPRSGPISGGLTVPIGATGGKAKGVSPRRRRKKSPNGSSSKRKSGSSRSRSKRRGKKGSSKELSGGAKSGSDKIPAGATIGAGSEEKVVNRPMAALSSASGSDLLFMSSMSALPQTSPAPEQSNPLPAPPTPSKKVEDDMLSTTAQPGRSSLLMSDGDRQAFLKALAEDGDAHLGPGDGREARNGRAVTIDTIWRPLKTPPLLDDRKWPTCAHCDKQFGINRWRFNCRLCGEVLCSECAPNFAKVPGFTNPERVCNNCSLRHFKHVTDVVRWDPDDLVSLCAVCSTSFTTFNRRHHCRACGRVVCGSCSPSTVMLPGFQTSQRACTLCTKHLDYITDDLEVPATDYDEEAEGLLPTGQSARGTNETYRL